MKEEKKGILPRSILAFSYQHLRIARQRRPAAKRMTPSRGLFQVGLGMILFMFFVTGCAQNPVSGRPEVALISTEKEQEIGANLARQIEESVGVLEDGELVAYVESLGRRLSEHSPRQDVEYTFNVLDMVEPNAFALPGGYVYVSRGLIALVNSEDELAGVIAHEIAHVAARHAVQRVNVAAATSPVWIATGITGLATSIVAPRLGQMVAGIGQMASGAVLAPYSRDQEKQADRIGQDLAATVGYDPIGISTFLETLDRYERLQSEERRRRSFFATHPSTPDRVSRTARQAADLTPADEKPIAKDRPDLLTRLDGLLVGNSPAEGVFIENRFLQPILDFTLRFPPNWEAVNGRNFVAAQAPDENALVLLHIAGKGDDPLKVAKTLEEQLGISLLENAESTQIGGLTAVRSVAVVRGSRGKVGLDLTWIGHGGVVYQITGMSPATKFEQYRKVLGETAESFRPLSDLERSTIEEARLRIVPARGGETLDQLVKRVGGVWTPEETAVANGIRPDASLREGQLIKVPIRQPYVAPPRSAVQSG